jgi:hypothetical protein
MPGMIAKDPAGYNANMPKRTRSPIHLACGGDKPLALVPPAGALIAECRGPAGAAGAAVDDAVTRAINEPAASPPLGKHVVPGDRVAIAVAGPIPQEPHVLAAVQRCLEAAGAAAGDTVTVREGPSRDADTAYLGADEEGLPLYLSREIVDADVVVSIGCWQWDATLGGRSLEGELWPTFSRPESRLGLLTQLATRGRRALAGWRSEMEQITWQVGVCASLRLVFGREGTLAAAAFGLPAEAGRQARGFAAEWSPAVSREAGLTIASVSHPLQADVERADCWGRVTRALAAAARVTHPGGTICLVTSLAEQPGMVFSRWRQGAPLAELVREAVGTGDPQLVADALQTRLFARALGDKRLVLLSELDESTVEDLEFGYAASPQVVERLAAKSESLTVIHEADSMFPRVK